MYFFTSHPHLECACRNRPNIKNYLTESKQQHHYIQATLPIDQYTWEGCSDNIKYANRFSRKFIDNTEKKSLNDRCVKVTQMHMNHKREDTLKKGGKNF